MMKSDSSKTDYTSQIIKNEKQNNYHGQNDHDMTKMIFEFCKMPHSAKEIMAQIQIQDRSYFRRHYLEPMIKAEQLKMTIPEKPKSRNQKYYTA